MTESIMSNYSSLSTIIAQNILEAQPRTKITTEKTSRNKILSDRTQVSHLEIL